MSTEEIIVDTGESKPAKPAKAEKKAAAKIEKPAPKKAAAKKAAAKKAPKKAAPKKEATESTRKRYEVKLTGENYSVKIDKAFEKKIAALGKAREAESVTDVMNYLLTVAFGRLAALKKCQDSQEK